MNTWKWNPEIIVAILTEGDVNTVCKELIMQKQSEIREFEKELSEQTTAAALISAGMKLPEESPGRRMADALLEDLRECYPEAVKKADKILAHRRAIVSADLKINEKMALRG